MATLKGSTLELGGRVWRVMAEHIEPKRATLTLVLSDEIVHQIPESPLAVTPCCGRTVFELPRTDRLTTDGYVTCGQTSADVRSSDPDLSTSPIHAEAVAPSPKADKARVDDQPIDLTPCGCDCHNWPGVHHVVACCSAPPARARTDAGA